LAADPIHKMLLDAIRARAAIWLRSLRCRVRECHRSEGTYRLGEALAASVMQRHAQRLRGRVRRVTLDLDPTDDPTHGAQQLSFFNRHYDSWCYLR